MNLNFSFQKGLNWCIYGVIVLILISLAVIGVAHLLKKPDYLPLDKAPAKWEQVIKKEPASSLDSREKKDSLYILSQLKKWQNSQRKGDLSLYLSTYSVVQFKWSGGNYNTWRTLKSRSFQNKKFDIKIRDVKIQSNGRRAISSFAQFTDSNGEFSLKKKNLYWMKEKNDNGENWLIYKEKETEL